MAETVPDEPWVDDATPVDVSERLVRLALMRAGHIAVRYTTGPSTVLGVRARRRRAKIEVTAEELGAPGLTASDWTERWTFSENLVDGRGVLTTLEDALAALSPPGSGGSVSLRLELHDEVEAYRNSYAFVVGWLIVVAITVAGARALGTQSSEGLLGVVARWGEGGRADDLGAASLLTAVALAAMLPAAVGAWCVERIADGLGWPYAVREPLEVGGAVIGCAAFLLAVILSGSSWGLVTALPWIVGIAWVVGVPLARRFAGWLRPAG